METPALPTALSERKCKVKRCKEPVVGSSTTGEGHVCNLHNIREWGRALANPKNPHGDRELGRSLLADARDLQAGLDDAQARLQTTVIPGQIDIEGKTMTDDPTAVKRTKNPSYIVLRLTETITSDEEAGPEAWRPVLGIDTAGAPVAISASSRRRAIEVATEQANDGELKSGTFAVIPAADFKVIQRAVRVEEISEFG